MQNDTDGDIRQDADTWYGKVGLRSRFSALGHTVFYGEYLNADGDVATTSDDDGLTGDSG